MRAEDPTAPGAIVMENYALFLFNLPDGTSSRAGARSTSPLHNGYAPVAPDDRANPRDVYRALWAAPMIAENLKTVDGRSGAAPRDCAERIRLTVTEWRRFHVTPASAWIDH
jgi:hypothetical protein